MPRSALMKKAPKPRLMRRRGPEGVLIRTSVRPSPLAVEGVGGGAGEPLGVVLVVGGDRVLAGEADEVGGRGGAVEGVAVDVVVPDDDGVDLVGVFAEVAEGGGGGGGASGAELLGGGVALAADGGDAGSPCGGG